MATEVSDPFDVRRQRSATGLLADFNRAGLLEAADVQVARRVGELGGEQNEIVLLAVALAVRGVRLGSVCLDLSTSHELDPTLSWPAVAVWAAVIAESPLTTVISAHGGGASGSPEPFPAALTPGPDGGRPLRLDAGRLYLDRYWRQELSVSADLLARERRVPPVVDAGRLRADVDRLFPGPPSDQSLAAAEAARTWTTVLVGGPGTGKTTTVARLLAVLAGQSDRPLQIALAAPTGKAAARLQSATSEALASLPADDQRRVGPLTASTLHRLLGTLPGSRSRFRHDRRNRMPHDVLVIDEVSMLSLSLMSSLLAAVRSDARLILLGDPDQLASVEAGAVLADVVDGLSGAPSISRRGVVVLHQNWRFTGGIAQLASAVRDSDPDGAIAVLEAGLDDVSFVPAEESEESVLADVVGAAAGLREAAEAGDAPLALRRLDVHRVLCAHRTGPAGVQAWDRRIEQWLAGQGQPPRDREWYAGRPLLITANNEATGLFNGDTGVVISGPEGELIAVFGRGPTITSHSRQRLSNVETVHAMTVHRSQGSQFQRVTLVLPPLDSPLLTREMLYTAITRATDQVRVIGSAEQVRAAIARPATRATGLRRRLRDG